MALKIRFILLTYLVLNVYMEMVYTQGTTLNLEEIFIGKCWQYQRVINPDVFKDGEKNCTLLWNLFHDAFAYKNPCGVPLEDFVPYALEAFHPLPKDKIIFWEGVYKFVQQFSYHGTRLTTIADTLSGYLGDQIVFCGKEDEPGVDTASCPIWGTCQNASDHSFWSAISEQFSSNAEGQVYVMMNGTSGAAFLNDSVFAKHELPNISPGRVQHVTVIVVHKYGHAVMESCGNGTIKTLQDRLTRQGLQHSCVDDPPSMRYMLCVDSPEALECKYISQILGYITSSSSSSMFTSLLYIVLAALLSCFVIL